MTMRATRIPVAVEFERVAVASRWADSRWQPSRVVPVEGDPDAADGAAVERVDATDVLERWRFPGQLTEMHPVEAEGYYLNVSTPDPKAFVMWRFREGREPPVETLTFDADFTAFMQPGVDPSLKHAALKRLFSDPRFNVMDGLDVYIDDYTKPDPIDAETVRGLVQARYLFDPPKTRVNERGEVEEVPPEAVADAGDEAAADEAPALREADAGAPVEPAPSAAPVERTEPADPKPRP